MGERPREGLGFLLIPCLITRPRLTPGQRPCRSHSNPSPRPTSEGPDYRDGKNGPRRSEREDGKTAGWKEVGIEGRKVDWARMETHIVCLWSVWSVRSVHPADGPSLARLSLGRHKPRGIEETSTHSPSSLSGKWLILSAARKKKQTNVA